MGKYVLRVFTYDLRETVCTNNNQFALSLVLMHQIMKYSSFKAICRLFRAGYKSS